MKLATASRSWALIAASRSITSVISSCRARRLLHRRVPPSSAPLRTSPSPSKAAALAYTHPGQEPLTVARGPIGIRATTPTSTCMISRAVSALSSHHADPDVDWRRIDAHSGAGPGLGRSPARASLCVPATARPAGGSSSYGGSAARFVAKPKLGVAARLSGSGSAGRRARGRALMCRHERGAAAQSVADSVRCRCRRRWEASPHLAVAVRGRVCLLAHHAAVCPARPRVAHDCLAGWECGGMSTPGEDGHPRGGAGIDPDRPAIYRERQPHSWRPG